ncbi:MAG: SDR family oxidoreductase [Sphingomonas sp.]|nr:SDR family oxidoreductase [Sphingomonas sp.]
MSELSLEGKVAIVTGGTSGIGLAIVAGLAGRGAQVLSVGRNRAAGEQTAARSPQVAFLAADLGDRGAPQRIVEEAVAQFGRVDVLVNGAGILARGDALECSDADWDQHLEINLTVPLRLSRAVLPGMIAAGKGSIINVASDWAIRAARRVVAYATTKAALAHLTRCMALDHAAQGIRINAVGPGDTDTPMLGMGLSPEQRRAFLAQCAAELPMGRVGKPEEIADLVTFLASEKSSFITGAMIPIDGGASC